MKKDCKALVTKNCLRRLINANLEQKDTEYEKKHQQTFQSKWLADFSRLWLDKAIAKINPNEFNRYENIFITAYVVSQNILPFTDHINGLHLGSDNLCRSTYVNFKTISEVLHNNVIDHMKQVQFISIMYRLLCHWSKGNTFKKCSPWHSWSWTRNYAIIKCLKRIRTNRILYGQVNFFR